MMIIIYEPNMISIRAKVSLIIWIENGKIKAEYGGNIIVIEKYKDLYTLVDMIHNALTKRSHYIYKSTIMEALKKWSKIYGVEL